MTQKYRDYLSTSNNNNITVNITVNIRNWVIDATLLITYQF